MKKQGKEKKVTKFLSMLLLATLFFSTQATIVFADTISENGGMENPVQSDNKNGEGNSYHKVKDEYDKDSMNQMEDISSQQQEVLSESNVSENNLRTGTGNPANPIHHCTNVDDGTDYTEFSYVYFGSYPQEEVTDSTMIALIDSAINTSGIATEEGIDVWINDIKYRRISRDNVENTAYFGDNRYRYFKWERIRWKVLNNEGNNLFLVADKVLDCKQYHDDFADVTWEVSTIRSWLNSSFYNTAFNNDEKEAIIEKRVVNEDNSYYDTEGGNNTDDSVYLLSIGEVTNEKYGFCSDYKKHSMSRKTKNSDYANARGTGREFEDNYCCWWLRSVGSRSDYAGFVEHNGYIGRGGTPVGMNNTGVCPALYINLLSDSWSVADDDTDKKKAAKPNATIPTGSSVAKNTKLFLTCATNGANIYYTIDGTEPTIESLAYTGAITLDQDMTIKAISVCEGYDTSDVAEFSYKIQENNNEEIIKVQNISISAPSKKLAAGKKVKLNLAITPKNASNKAVTWKTSNKKFATVDKNGKLTLKKAGAGKYVTITAEAKDGSGQKAAIKIKIMKHAVKSIKLKALTDTLKAGKSMSIKATVKTTGKSVNKTLKWQSSNTKYATVNKKGKVTAKKAAEGKTVIITAASADGSNKKAKVKIKIK